MVSIAHPRPVGISNPTASIVTFQSPASPYPHLGRGQAIRQLDCNGNKHGGRVSEDIPGAAAVVFGARYGALGVIWPFCCIGLVQKSQKYAL